MILVKLDEYAPRKGHPAAAGICFRHARLLVPSPETFPANANKDASHPTRHPHSMLSPHASMAIFLHCSCPALPLPRSSSVASGLRRKGEGASSSSLGCLVLPEFQQRGRSDLGPGALSGSRIFKGPHPPRQFSSPSAAQETTSTTAKSHSNFAPETTPLATFSQPARCIRSPSL